MKNLLAALYKGSMSLRTALYRRGVFRSYASSLPIICVGNIAAGGSGKTPFVQILAEFLSKRGYEPVVLLRGYGGKLSGPLQVSAQYSASQVGDEALLHHLKLTAPVVVSRDRVAGAKFIEEARLGNVIIMDDGLQHLRLQRDVNIVSIDLRDPQLREDFRLNRCLPAGLLRESKEEALKRCHMVVFNHRGPRLRLEEFPAVESWLGPVTLPNIHVWISSAQILRGERELLPPHNIVAVSGVARPAGFFDLLQSLGFQIIARHAFPDHQPFQREVIQKLRKDFPETPFVCTEKDYVRFSAGEESGWWRLVPQYEVDRPEVFEQAFTANLKERIGLSRSAK